MTTKPDTSPAAIRELVNKEVDDTRWSKYTRIEKLRECMHMLSMLADEKEAKGVPEGWQLVPIEPTREMLDVGRVNLDYELCASRQVWSAMLAAAPKEPKS